MGNGGTAFSEYLKVEEGNELTAALNSIAQVVAVSCEFEVGSLDRDIVDFNRVIVTFDEETIPRNDNSCADGLGWSWRDDQQTVIQLCVQACDRLQDEMIENMEIKLACSDDDVFVIE